MNENELAKDIVNLSFKIHNALGPGLFESVYEEIICYELHKVNYHFLQQRALPVVYESIQLDVGFRADIVVENKLIIEIKSVEALAPVHSKQLLTYLRLSHIKLGLLINFNVVLIKDGIHRIVNGL